MGRLSPVKRRIYCYFPATRSTRRAASGGRSLMGGRHMRTERTGLFALAVTLVGFAATAQDAKKPEAAKDAKDAKKAPPIAFVGADVYTVTKGIIRNGTVVVENGKITHVGQDIEI